MASDTQAERRVCTFRVHQGRYRGTKKINGAESLTHSDRASQSLREHENVRLFALCLPKFVYVLLYSCRNPLQLHPKNVEETILRTIPQLFFVGVKTDVLQGVGRHQEQLRAPKKTFTLR